MKNTILAYLILIILIIAVLVLSYFKFFTDTNKNITEKPINNSAEEAINIALKEIVENFNNDEKINEYSNQNIKINATLKNNSIFVSYQTDRITTYEFIYGRLNLSTTIIDDEDNLKKFEKVFILLNNAIQKRLNETIDTENKIHSFLEKNKQINGITKVKSNGKIKITIDITKKIEDKTEGET